MTKTLTGTGSYVFSRERRIDLNGQISFDLTVEYSFKFRRTQELSNTQMFIGGSAIDKKILKITIMATNNLELRAQEIKLVRGKKELPLVSVQHFTSPSSEAVQHGINVMSLHSNQQSFTQHV